MVSKMHCDYAKVSKRPNVFECKSRHKGRFVKLTACQSCHLFAGNAGAGDQLINGTKALGRVSKQLVQRKPVFVNDEEHARRIAICNSCVSYNAEQDKCMRCGCKGALKTKTATESCPIGKWGAIDLKVRGPEIKVSIPEAPEALIEALAYSKIIVEDSAPLADLQISEGYPVNTIMINSHLIGESHEYMAPITKFEESRLHDMCAQFGWSLGGHGAGPTALLLNEPRALEGSFVKDTDLTKLGALVTDDEGLVIKAISAGVKVATLTSGIYTGTLTTLECLDAGRLAWLDSWQLDMDKVKNFFGAMLRRTISKDATVNEIVSCPAVIDWVSKIRS